MLGRPRQPAGWGGGCSRSATAVLRHATASPLTQARPHLPALQVTFIEAMDNLMPGFDKEIARMAQRLLIQGRPIDYHTGVIATKVTPGVPGECGL